MGDVVELPISPLARARVYLAQSDELIRQEEALLEALLAPFGGIAAFLTLDKPSDG